MKRLDPHLTEEDIAQLGGHVGPTAPGERVSAGRKPERSAVPIKVPRTNHLPARRPLFAEQDRVPE